MGNAISSLAAVTGLFALAFLLSGCLQGENKPATPSVSSIASSPTPGPGVQVFEASFSTPDGWELPAYYAVPGQGKGRTVIMLHMLSSDRTSWNSLSNALLEKGFAVLAVDQRGHGGATLAGKKESWQSFGEGDFAKMVDDVAAFSA